MCESAQASVNQMVETFASLSADTSFDTSRFKPTVDSIKASFDAEWSWYDPYIPFNPACCTLEKIGQQADILTNQMLSSVGADPVTGPSTGPGIDPLILAGVLFAAFLLVREVRR